MAFSQTPGSGSGTTNHGLSANAPSFTPSSRGRGRGRGAPRNGLAQTDSLLVAEISRETLDHTFTAGETKITDFEHLASYNWLDDRHPTIAVPGVPSLLDTPSTPVQVRPDKGMHFVDQNGARNPNSPLEPLFRSLFAVKPDFDVSAVDLVSDRNNIRKLLKFVNARTKGLSAKDKFEIKAEVVGDRTLLFTRVEPKTERWSNGTDNYGHNFEAAITKDHIGKSHHRIVSYDLGGLKIINRFECDAYLIPEIEPPAVESSIESCADSSTAPSPLRRNPPRSCRPVTTPATLSNLLGGLAIATPTPTTGSSLADSGRVHSSTLATNSSRYVPPARRGVQIRHQGSLIPASQTIEIKTRAASRVLDYHNILTQMWISQTPHLVAGYFDPGGCFMKIDCNDMTLQIQEWEKRNESNLQKLLTLIKWIRENLQNAEGKRGTLRFEGRGVLKVMGMEPDTCVPGTTRAQAQHRAAMRLKSLPDDLYAKWAR
ncbi:hypothetical protein FKW77_002906 [Venturia effusa]|uniref:Decapping nuclease n=1 Tax=Venturia effusa TaxID=50376 RepID=A0A517LJV3_9PEZI|nr:hypothetical protein FKW77_002906 [Venturia effusa]